VQVPGGHDLWRPSSGLEDCITGIYHKNREVRVIKPFIIVRSILYSSCLKEERNLETCM